MFRRIAVSSALALIFLVSGLHCQGQRKPPPRPKLDSICAGYFSYEILLSKPDTAFWLAYRLDQLRSEPPVIVHIPRSFDFHPFSDKPYWLVYQDSTLIRAHGARKCFAPRLLGAFS